MAVLLVPFKLLNSRIVAIANQHRRINIRRAAKQHQSRFAIVRLAAVTIPPLMPDADRLVLAIAQRVAPPRHGFTIARTFRHRRQPRGIHPVIPQRIPIPNHQRMIVRRANPVLQIDQQKSSDIGHDQLRFGVNDVDLAVSHPTRSIALFQRKFLPLRFDPPIRIRYQMAACDRRIPTQPTESESGL